VKQQKEYIGFLVSKQSKEKIKQMAKEEGLTMTQLILKSLGLLGKE